MIVHIVMFKFKPDLPDAAQSAYALLSALPPKIDVIRTYELGLNIIESERAYDLSLYSTFDSLDDLDAYIYHPEHQAAVGKITPTLAGIHSVDYELIV